MGICINVQKIGLFHRFALEKCLQSYWLRAFWPISQEQHFSQIEDLYKNTVNNINFHYRTNSRTINDQNFLNSKTLFLTHFWPTSPILGGKKCFPKKSGMHNLIRFSSFMQKFWETSWSNSKKTTQQAAGWKDWHTLCHGTLPAIARGLTSTTSVDWHLKVKHIEYDFDLTKNYCITVSMQKISWIHKLILWYSRFLDLTK